MNLQKLTNHLDMMCFLGVAFGAVLIPLAGAGIGYPISIASSGFGLIICLINGVVFRDMHCLKLGRIFAMALGLFGGLYLGGYHFDLRTIAWIYFGNPFGTAIMLVLFLLAAYLIIEAMIKKLFRLKRT